MVVRTSEPACAAELPSGLTAKSNTATETAPNEVACENARRLAAPGLAAPVRICCLSVVNRFQRVKSSPASARAPGDELTVRDVLAYE